MWRETEEGELLVLNNQMSLLVFEGEGLWWYQILGCDPPEDAILSQFHAPTRDAAKRLGLETVIDMAARMKEAATNALKDLP